MESNQVICIPGISNRRISFHITLKVDCDSLKKLNHFSNFNCLFRSYFLGNLLSFMECFEVCSRWNDLSLWKRVSFYVCLLTGFLACILGHRNMIYERIFCVVIKFSLLICLQDLLVFLICLQSLLFSTCQGLC